MSLIERDYMADNSEERKRAHRESVPDLTAGYAPLTLTVTE